MTALMRWGYDAFGNPRYFKPNLQPNQHVCKDCEGSGFVYYDNGVDGFSKVTTGTCEACDGEGTITQEEEE